MRLTCWSNSSNPDTTSAR